jgi:hypothetical protein
MREPARPVRNRWLVPPDVDREDGNEEHRASPAGHLTNCKGIAVLRVKIVSVAAAVLLAAGGVFAVATYAAADTTAVTDTAPTQASKLPAFAGHTYVITVDNGTVFRNTFSADGTKLHGVTTAGFGAGNVVDVSINVGLISRDRQTYFISWVEPDTTTVSQVFDICDRTVQIFFTFTDATGVRSGQLHNATLQQIS